MDKKNQINLAYILLIIAVVVVVNLFRTAGEIADISYRDFRDLLAEGQIARVEVSDNRIMGEFSYPREGKTRFVTERVDEDLLEILDAAGVDYQGAPEMTALTSVLSWFLPMMLFVAIWFFLIRRLGERQ
ncbi:MAG: ATP-dependent metallopeptidase FtsH/Yme1/Tma family protein, partial [Pseudomonadota bacterium]